MELNTIYNSDCIEFLKDWPGNSIDLFLFSPPYDKIRDYNNKLPSSMPIICYQIERVLVDGGICVVVIQDQTNNFRKSLTTFQLAIDWQDAALSLWECLIYQRPGRPGAWWSKRFRVDHEYILVFFKGEKPQYFSKEHMKIPCKHAGKSWKGTQRHTDGSLSKKSSTVKDTKCPGTVLSYAVSSTEGNKLKMKHPATFPDKLASDMIQVFTKPGMVVCDPMCGSGTTLVQAHKLDRQYIGIDISEEYCKIARERLKEE